MFPSLALMQLFGPPAAPSVSLHPLAKAELVQPRDASETQRARAVQRVPGHGRLQASLCCPYVETQKRPGSIPRWKDRSGPQVTRYFEKGE